MSPTLQAVLAAGVLLFVGGLVGWWTWRVRLSSVVWRRVPDSRLVHAIRRVELRARAPEVDSVGLCGAWPVARLDVRRRSA